MKFFVLSGSHRKEAQSLKVARYAESILAREHAGGIDPGNSPLGVSRRESA